MHLLDEKSQTGSTMKPNRRILALATAALAFPLAAIAQDDEAREEVVVVEKKSTSQLRRDVYDAEEAFYDLYNELNENPEFDVKCYYETQTGTHVKNHVCRAQFVADSYAKHAGRNRNDLTRMANQDADPAMVAKTARFEEILGSLVNSNAELQAAFLRYNNARAEFFEARE
jgi:hypothetical protein